MRRSQLLSIVGLVLIALATAVAVVGIASLGGDGEPEPVVTLPDDVLPEGGLPGAGLPEEGITAVGVLGPRTILFGDTVRASVDVLLDRREVDPASVRVATEFVPWEIVGAQSRVRRDAGLNTHLRTTFTLRCTGSPCLPADESSALEFNPARVTYLPADEPSAARESLTVGFPVLLVYSRFAAANLDGPGIASLPWRADLDTFPAASYRVAPGILIVALIGLAGVLAAAGIALAVIAIPRRSPVPEPEPEPEPEPVVVLTPLEQALELLEDAGRADGAEDRRRALELVAEVLDLDHPDLARAARSLAWSEDDPLVEQTSGLATRVRTTIEIIGNEPVNGSGNGRAH
jgi:hypothetical protein